MSGVDFAGDTISIVHRDRRVEVAPNWATVSRLGVSRHHGHPLDPPLMPLIENNTLPQKRNHQPMTTTMITMKMMMHAGILQPQLVALNDDRIAGSHLYSSAGHRPSELKNEILLKTLIQLQRA